MSPGALDVENGIIFAVLMPHAPILVPEVGRRETGTAIASVRAMRIVAERLECRRPAIVVVISPHSPRKPHAFGIWAGNRLLGSFSQFGAPQASVTLPNALRLVKSLEGQAGRLGLPMWEISAISLDHGALVPLWYLVQAGWRGPTAVVSLNYPGEGQLSDFGAALRAATAELRQPVAIVASGDMSHRLTINAPAGYEPCAKEFDQTLIRFLRAGAYHELEHIDAALQERAAEDAVDSTTVALAAVNWRSTGHEVLSYEGPFGVGYGVAVLFDSVQPAPLRSREAQEQQCYPIWLATLPRVARNAVKSTLFETLDLGPPAETKCLSMRRGLFVTIRNLEGEVRGCVGTLSPKWQNVIEETRRLAHAAAFLDTRFPAVTPEEYPNLCFEISIVGPLEPVSSEADLDPSAYGVVATTRDGREGCLLPDVEGVRSIAQQVAFVRLKGGIQPGEHVRLHRFRTLKLYEGETVSQRENRSQPVNGQNHAARWWQTLPDGRIECQVCPRGCKLKEGQRGFCFVRQRLKDQLVLTAYGQSSGFCIDPVEKKPLNHFYPGSAVLSFGTVGCNLACRFCQNWDQSHACELTHVAENASPELIARTAKKLGCKAVAFTFNDPVIFAEFAIDTAQACHALGVKTIAVTAGYIRAVAREELFQHMDAAKVELKGFTDAFYRKMCGGRLNPVIETLEYLHHDANLWLEVSSLLIPGENDDEAQLHWAADWFAKHLGRNVPWHFTAFHPDYRLLDKPATPLPTLMRARAIALSKGLRYVYIGNFSNPVGSTTRCPRCGRVLIERQGHQIQKWELDASGGCSGCGFALPGRFDKEPGTRAGQHRILRLN